MRTGTIATPTTSVWYVRKNGWVQGPFSPTLVRQMYSSAWIGAVDRVGRSRTGPWEEVREVPELRSAAAEEGFPAPADGWEVASPLLSMDQPVEFGMLQMFAAAGRLRPNDLVRRLPDGVWERAGHVGGIFGGRRVWCTACGASLDGHGGACAACGAAQPGYEWSLADVAMFCGVVGCLWYWIALFAVTMPAIFHGRIYDVELTENFPGAYLLAFSPSFWLAVLAVWFGRVAVKDVRAGRAAPAEASPASTGLALGWFTLGLLLLATVAVVAFSLPFFGIVRA
jgi:hypothetical protein